MTFGEALDLMRKGRVVRRRGWRTIAPSFYISEARNKLMGMRHGKPTGVSVTVFHEDLLAQDWEVSAEGFAPNEKASRQEESASQEGC